MILKSFLNERIVIKAGDITAETSDAIVNAANKTLLGGGGVDGAIHKKGGPLILAECRRIREAEYPDGLPTGFAVLTTSGDLPSRYVIHTVGPIYGRENGNEASLLADCYSNCITLAENKGLKSISFPSISTGAFQYPKHLAARIASVAVMEAISKIESIDYINLVFFTESDAKRFLKHARFI